MAEHLPTPPEAEPGGDLIEAILQAVWAANSAKAARAAVSAILFPPNDDDAVLAVLKAHAGERGDMPTIREIATILSKPRTNVHNALRRLEGRGLIKVLPNVRRGIRLKTARA